MNTQEYEARACWSMRRKAGTYEYVAASRREEVLSGGEGDRLEANDAKSFRGECYSVLARLVPF